MDWLVSAPDATLTRFLLAVEGLPAMKLLGFLLLLAGWAIVLAAIILLPSATVRATFVLSGIAVEVLGFALVIRSHLLSPGEIR